MRGQVCMIALSLLINNKFKLFALFVFACTAFPFQGCGR
jgi:hypothetical protein